MRRFNLVVAAALGVAGAAALFSGEPVPAADRPQIGAVERVEPTAAASFAEEERALSNAAPVYLDDTLWTGPDGRLLVRLDDGTEVTLGAGAQLLVDRFVYAPAEGQGDLALRSLEGAFLFVGGGIEAVAERKVEIDTSVATLGVRGTRFFAGPIDDGYGVFTFEGSVEVKTDGGTVVVEEGFGTMVQSRAEPPSDPVMWRPEKIGRAIDLIGFR